MPAVLHLLISTPGHRYVVRRDDIDAIRLVDATPMPEGERKDSIKVDLGALCDPVDQSLLLRRHGLYIPLRRKQIIIMVDRIDTLLEPIETQALPALLQRRLGYPWATGALMIADELVIQLDLRAVARSILLTPQAC